MLFECARVTVHSRVAGASGRLPSKTNKESTPMLARLKIPSLVAEGGQTLVEYALIIAMVSIACIAALGLVGAKISDVMNTITTTL